jgi:hypothetical protein
MSRKSETKSRSAREVMLTRYAMRGFEFAEELLRRPGSSLAGVFQSLTDAFSRVSLRGDIKQALVSLRILNDSRSFAVNGQHNRTFALFDLLEEFARSAAEGGERLNVGGDIEHEGSIAPLKVLNIIRLWAIKTGVIRGDASCKLPRNRPQTVDRY